MNRERLASIKQSPILFIGLMLTASILAAAWRHTAHPAPPNLPGYDWSEHPRAILLAYPADDCSCGASPTQWAQIGLSHGLDVVVVAAGNDGNINSLRQLSNPRLHLITSVDAAFVKNLSPDKTTRALRIEDGVVVGKAQGELPSNEFWQP